jgi:hypothetical protein
MTLRESHLRRVALDLEDIIPVVERLDAVGSMYFPAGASLTRLTPTG